VEITEEQRSYIAIDLKSFYASVECIERGLDPLDTNLVVADGSRTEKTICLAVSPSLKAHGISGRARLFEVVSAVKDVNRRRKYANKGEFTGSSYIASELAVNGSLALDYIVATPRMALYMEYSTRVYEVYLKHIAPEDIHVYSVDEVFIDATAYLKMKKTDARSLAKMLISEVKAQTGLTATAGVGSNLYLCKVAMDILAKTIPADREGVRIACLDERAYREKLWGHRPLTDFWRVGRGYAAKLEGLGIYTMGDIARCSLRSEDTLYRLFGINAELLIDHAWGYESCRMSDIKSYRPTTTSISSGQVLSCPYSFEKARLILREMADLMALDLVEKRLVTAHVVLTVGYDAENIKDSERSGGYRGEITTDHYGRRVPKQAHGSANIERRTSSSRLITEALLSLYERIVDPSLSVRRINIALCNLQPDTEQSEIGRYEQLDLFTDNVALAKREEEQKKELERENRMQRAVVGIKARYGKNAIVKGMNLEEGATSMERNRRIGGHKA